MGIVEIDAADGRRWTVRRRFRWPRWRKVGPDLDGGDVLALMDLEFALGPLVFGLFLAILVGLVIVVLLPLFLFIAELALVVPALLLLRGTWIVEAATLGPPPEKKAWKVRGPFRSKRAVEEVAAELRAGVPAAPEEGDPLPPASER